MKTAAEAHRVRATENEVAPSERLVVETARRRRAANPTTWLVPIFFGLIQAIDAAFKWTPQFQHTFMKIVAGGAETQPGWLGPWYQFWESALKPFAPWSLGIWAIPEGFGNTSRVAYTDIGTSIINVTVFAALWALDSCTGPRRYSLDALIERRFPRWKRIAEVRDSEG